MSINLTKDLATEYIKLFESCQIQPNKHPEVKSIRDKIVAHKSRYQAIETSTKVPWYVVAAFHSLEGSLNFGTHLHNGDPLTARTINVPSGRPLQGTPPFTWEQSAIDALQFDHLTDVTEWNLPTILFKLESFNGFGYRTRHPEVLTPYLWSFSNHYTKGKFIGDHKYDPEKISDQCGAAIILKEMIDLGDITIPTAHTALSDTEESEIREQDKYKVSDKADSGLFLRSEPIVEERTKIAVLPMGQPVVKVADSNEADWWQVSTIIQNVTVTGFVNSKYLIEELSFVAPSDTNKIVKVQLTPNIKVTRNDTNWRYPLNEIGQPTRNSNESAIEKAKQLTQIIDWLDVENKSRYQPRTHTYCNIYAHDYCYLAGVYLPRVWWTDNAIQDLKAGKTVVPIYEKTVDEINANSLFNWLVNYGSTFGWRRTFDLTEMQNAANNGQVVIISAKNKIPNYSGHICAVVPEISSHRAVRNEAKVIMPLQSQAGRHNYKYRTSTWWTMSDFRNFGFWINES